jgi:hypothetical protein
MASLAPEASHVEAPAFAQPRRRVRTAPRPKTARGIVGIVVVGVLLIGIVGISVAVLRLNLQLDKLGREKIQLQNENRQLAGQWATQQATGVIQDRARAAGLVPAPLGSARYVYLPEH